MACARSAAVPTIACRCNVPVMSAAVATRSRICLEYGLALFQCNVCEIRNFFCFLCLVITVHKWCMWLRSIGGQSCSVKVHHECWQLR